MPQSGTNFHIPDLVALCGDSFELRTNPRCHKAAADALLWVKSQGLIDQSKQDIIPQYQLGLLASLCYPTCDYTQLKLIIDIITYIALDGPRESAAYDECVLLCIIDTVTERLVSIWVRLQRGTTLAWQADFQNKLHVLRQSRQFVDAKPSTDSDIEIWLAYKRRTSGVLLGFALIEYASDLVIPNDSQTTSTLQELVTSAADVLVWFEEIVSYNIRQARDDKSSLVFLLSSGGRSIQDAINVATARAKAALSKFLVLGRETGNREVDASARRYIRGLQDCIIGFAHWVYETDVYFLGQGEEVRAFGWVFMLPKSDTDPMERWMSEQRDTSNDT